MTRRNDPAANALMGNPGKRKPSGLVVSTQPPRCPTWLSSEGKLEWKRILRSIPAGTITTLDRAALAIYCQAWADWLTHSATVRREGATIEGTRGTKRHPAAIAANEAKTTMLALARELGLTPASRRSLPPAPPSHGDDFESILSIA